MIFFPPVFQSILWSELHEGLYTLYVETARYPAARFNRLIISNFFEISFGVGVSPDLTSAKAD